jgi:signal transduction histidine kinase
MLDSTSTMHPPLPQRFVLGVVVILTGSLGIFYLLMRPPLTDLGLMAVMLGFTALVSAVAGYAAYRLGWLERSPALRWSLLGSYLLSSLLTFLNVWLTARLMFADEHDLQLAFVLLVFATGIAAVLGYFLSGALTDRIEQLRCAAQSIAKGDLSARASVHGSDELSTLALSFNEMAAQLQNAQQKQLELDGLRRDLIAWVSHDLQTPLTSMRAMIEALTDGVVEDEETVKRYLLTVQREIHDLSLLIDDLFQIAQIDAGGMVLELGEESLTDLISDTLESFSEIAVRRGITLEGSVKPGLDPVWMDAQRISRVINNLVANAMRYTPRGGVVQVSAVRNAGRVEVVVSDSGPGIAPVDLPYVFDRFYRGEKSRSRLTGGAGLGLAIARGIVQAHGGEISVQSPPGEGTRFRFSLPGGSQLR